MSPRLRRIVIPLIVIAAALGIVAITAYSPDSPPPSAEDTTEVVADAGPAEPDPAIADEPMPDAGPDPAADAEAPPPQPALTAPVEDGPAVALTDLRARPVAGVDPETLATLGSLNPLEAPTLIEFDEIGRAHV